MTIATPKQTPELETASDQLCEICGKSDSPFGYGPPHHPQTIWRCGEHRLEGPVPRLPLFPRFLELVPAEVIERMVSAWVESNWPTVTDSSTCRHCGRKDENLIPLGYGAGPRIWVHHHCSDLFRAELKRRARVAMRFEGEENLSSSVA